jgi:hypothetical protein
MGGGEPHRRRLRDDIATVKTTYRLLHLATMLLSLRQHGQLEMLLSQRCWHSSCLMVSMFTASRWAAPRERGFHTVSIGGCRALTPSGGS